MTLPDQPWRADAACRDVSKSVFYPTSEHGALAGMWQRQATRR